MLPRILSLWDRIRDYVTIGLFVSLLAVTVLWRFSVADVALEKEGRRADHIAFEAAQSKAEAKALTLKIEQEAKDEKRKEKADEVYATLDTKYDALLVRYAQAQRTASRSNLSKASGTPEGSNGLGENTLLPETIIIPYKDAEVCAENTARLEAVHQWATQ